MIIGGKNSVVEAVKSGKTINKVMIESSRHDEFTKSLINECRARHIRFDFVDKKRLDTLSPHHQGVVAEVTDYKYYELDDILNSRGRAGHLIVVLDGIEDPHNFGSIIRVCECAGVDGIVISKRNSATVNDTVYKTSAGAVSLVKIARVTNINDAIKTLKVDPVGYFFSPRIVAAGITVPMVVLIAEVVGILGGLIVSYFTIGLHPARYITSVWLWLSAKDIYISLLKAFVFGILIALVCATQGYETKGGAKDVGISTTRAAVLSTVYMLFADFIINLIFYL